jgi:hypothetical protein
LEGRGEWKMAAFQGGIVCMASSAWMAGFVECFAEALPTITSVEPFWEGPKGVL